MYQANHDAIVQNLNYDLVTLRQTEVMYFVNFFSTFGTQSALMAGFLAASISQVPGLEIEVSYIIKQTYWLSTAVGFVTAMHVLICTVFLAVYGQGLALRGPVGSMMVAVEGMVYEQQQIVFVFVISVIFFSISTVATFFIMVPFMAAVYCTILMCIGFYCWYYYTLRIYNRFQFKKYERTWSMTSEDDFQSKSYDFLSSKDKILVNDEKVFRKSVNASESNERIPNDKGISMQVPENIPSSDNNKTRNSVVDPRQSESERGSIINKFKGIFSSSKSKGKVVRGSGAEDDLRASLLRDDNDTDQSFNNYRASNTASETRSTFSRTHYGIPQATLGDNLRLAYCGFITMNISNSSLFNDEWKRRYVVVNNNFMFYYEDKQTFERSPENTIKRRPTDLEGYKLQIVSEDVPFVIQLTPIESEDDRKGIIFQCDTKAEADQWIAVLNTATNLHEL